MKAVLLTTDKYGHVNPAIHLAEKLVNEGWEVVFPNDKKFEEAISSKGIQFYDHSLFDFHYESANDMKPFEGMKRNAQSTVRILPKLLEYLEAEAPDLVISDRVFAWGRLAADKLGLKVITFSATPFMTADLILKYNLLWESLYLSSLSNLRAIIPAVRSLEKLARMLGKSIPEIMEILSNNEAAVNIVFTSKEIHPLSERYPDSYKFLGPAIDPEDFQKEPDFDIPEDAAYVSLGTVYNGDIDFFRTVRDYYAKSGKNVIISVQSEIAKELEFDKYENITYSAYLPQKALLTKVKYFITHGGYNSMNESIYARTPMISIPQMLEQKLNALRTEELECGVACLEVKDLPSKIEELEKNYDKYKAGVVRAAESYKDVDKWESVFADIMKFVGK